MMFKFKKKKANENDSYREEILRIVKDQKEAIEQLQKSIETLQRLAEEGS